MSNVCLPKEFTDKFKQAIKDGTINPETIMELETSEQRRAFLEPIVGKENVQWVNAQLESKLILKNQQAGMLRWAQSVAGLTQTKRADLVERINKLDKVLNPAEQDAFLADLAAQKLGVSVTAEEAQKIATLAKKASEAKAGGVAKEYGDAYVELENYVNSLSEQTLKEQFKERPITMIAGTAKSAKASLDDSAIFRQGWRTMFTNPMIWMRNSVKTFSDFARTLEGKAVQDEVRSRIVSDPNFEKMKTAKLAVGTNEEAYPTSIPEMIPILGRLYKASENAYTGFVHRMRADVFNKYLEIAEASGVDINDKTQLESIGKLVNSLTGRADLGKYEKAADVVNSVFFSPRSVKATFDVLTLHAKQDMSSFARKQAAINLVKMIAGMAAIIGIANAIAPGSVETDPRSADFGKIKVGNTRFDITGGMSSLITLAARFFSGTSKSSTTGIVTKLNTSEFGSKSSGDVVQDFLRNKLSPAASVVNDVFFRHADFAGNKPTLGGELKNLLLPLPITTYQELAKDPNSANKVVAMLADALGIAVNDYGDNSETAKIGEAIKTANEAKQAGEKALTNRQLAVQIYGADPTSAQLNDVAKQSAFYKKFGYDDEFANKLNRATDETTKVSVLDEARDSMTEQEFKDFMAKAKSNVTLASGKTSDILISDAFARKYSEYVKTGEFKQTNGTVSSDKYVAERGTIGTVIDFARAIGKDPQSAWKILTTKEELGVVKGDLVEKQRFFGEKDYTLSNPNGSEAYIKKQFEKMGIKWADREKYNLEHIVPVKAGGYNSDDNLAIIDRALHNKYTPFDVAVSKAVQDERLSMKAAAALSKRLKVSKEIDVAEAIRLANLNK
jgi:hypothetical protein